MAVHSSALYTKLDTNKYLGDTRDRGGRLVPIPFEHTAASDTTSDTVLLCTIPANCEVVSLECITDGMGGSVTIAIGDSGDIDRLMVATAMAASGNRGTLAITGMRYRPSADVTVYATIAGANFTDAKIFKGTITIVPGS